MMAEKKKEGRKKGKEGTKKGAMSSSYTAEGGMKYEDSSLDIKYMEKTAVVSTMMTIAYI